MLEFDGSMGEGGGQIIRTALALSAVTGKAFRVTNIRASRPEPGLKAQHLHCIEGIKQLCDAKVQDGALGSSTLEVIPQQLHAGTIALDVGTAGSLGLVLQAVLLPALFAKGRVKFQLQGGTDVAWAMPIDYFTNVLIPHLRKYADITVTVEKRGYYPAGGGKVEVMVKPKFELSYGDELLSLLPKIALQQQGKLLNIKGISHASADLTAAQVAERQANAAREVLMAFGAPIHIHTEYSSTQSSGSGITLWAQFGSAAGMDFGNPIILGSDQLGKRGVPAEQVGKEAGQKLAAAIESGACVDAHLADNLIPFLGIFGGKMRVETITEHTRTNIVVMEQFLQKKFIIANDTNSIQVQNG